MKGIQKLEDHGPSPTDEDYEWATLALETYDDKFEGMKELTDDWLGSKEREEAWIKFNKEISLYDSFLLRDRESEFEHSQEFANARNSFRKRING